MELKLNKPIPEDTICAISTAPGMGGIAVIRISGTNAIIITDRIFYTANKKKLSEAKPNTAHYG
jgi:tRNA modification GTPase